MKIVICNCPPAKAEEIAQKLVEERLAACVNIIPLVKSYYYWEGKLCQDQESTLLIKIRKGDFALIQERLQQLHPYTVPEIVELNLSEANTSYLQWVYEMTRRP